MHDDLAEQDVNLALLAENGQQALATLWKQFEDRLQMMVRLRLDRRLLGRVDADDVLQEAFMEVCRRLDDYLEKPGVPVFIWLRTMTLQTLVNVHRRHLGAKVRTAQLEVSLQRSAQVLTSSLDLARWMVASSTSPSNKAIRNEMLEELRAAFETMDAIDREVLALRHFEELTNTEVAEVLGLQKAAASNRYIRALTRLRDIMKKLDSTG